ncbi:hypothetical protein SCHPADRAFT_302482 [Schizopora paradoxa]|uniref:Zn(2)-C6 fungal-type domain-containing protein n=1 Tax=Schizopora paradoxa TaxID=27342 RepID=A0A0H2SCL1_9AGAM|nr:hypothetical protein SCHPADRAFT_302482 [Schizopora paradoxa]
MSSDVSSPKLEQTDIDLTTNGDTSRAPSPCSDAGSLGSRGSSLGHVMKQSNRSRAAKNRNRKPCASCTMHRTKCEVIEMEGKRRLCKKCDKRGFFQCPAEPGKSNSNFIQFEPKASFRSLLPFSLILIVEQKEKIPQTNPTENTNVKTPVEPDIIPQVQYQPKQEQHGSFHINQPIINNLNNLKSAIAPVARPQGQLTINVYIVGGGPAAVGEVLRGILPLFPGCQRQDIAPPAYGM